MIKLLLLLLNIRNDRKLHFSNKPPLPKPNITHNIPSALTQPILNPNQLKLIPPIIIPLNHMLNQPNNLLLIGMKLTPKQIKDLHGD
jgi:hypothetical protein